MDVPVLFIVFNRLQTTKRVFSQIKLYRPRKLYIASDGPRPNISEEAKTVQEVRDYLLAEIDWDCEVKTLFRDENIGCKYGPQNAITWFFENEEQGIVLEDDCLPSNSFFKFCEELLLRYKEDFRVFGISGANFHSQVPIKNSYYFSSYFFTWGWASWRSRWQMHLEILDSFESYIDNPNLKYINSNKQVSKILRKVALDSYKDELDAWDYLWILSCMINNGLIATSHKNLIQNIGFGDDATHTSGNINNQKPNEIVDFPLKHPTIFQPNKIMDALLFKNTMYWIGPLEKIISLQHIKAYNIVMFQRFKKMIRF